jgi:aryl-alcohol dehydrogenase-like predicted oxidoreductase
VLGEALASIPRDSFVLATKLFFPMSSEDRGLSGVQVHKQLDASLARLRTEYVDLYQCHRYDPDTPLEETMHALSEVVRAGKVRYIGFSEWPAEKISAALAIPGVERFVSSQPQYSLLWRQPEKEVIPRCREGGISQIVWSPLGQGVLTGKYRFGQLAPADSRAASPSMGGFIRESWLARPVLEAVQRLDGIARQHGLTAAQLALAWVLREPNVACAIIGATRPEQVTENAAVSGAAIDPSALDEVGRIFAPFA